jgi:hypothetical protein
LIAHHHRITAQQLTRIAPQARLHAIGQKPHGGQRRHGQSHREHEQAQITCTQVSPQISATQSQAVHPSLLVHAVTLPHNQFTATGKANAERHWTIRPAKLMLMAAGKSLCC